MVNVFDLGKTVSEPGFDTLMHLVGTHFPAHLQLKGVKFTALNSVPLTELKGQFKDWINLDLIRLALNGFEKKKSPGPDGLKPVVFDHLPAEYLEFLEIISYIG